MFFHFLRTSPLISSPLLQCCITVIIGIHFFYLWFVTLFVNLLCETCKFYSMFWVKIATEGRKLFLSSEYHAKWSFFKSSTLPCGFIKKKSLLVSPIWTWICITMLTHAYFKNRIRSHEKPENLDSTWSKHVRTSPKTLTISRQRLTDNVSLTIFQLPIIHSVCPPNFA